MKQAEILSKDMWVNINEIQEDIQKWETRFRETDRWIKTCAYVADSVQSAKQNEI